MFLGSPMPSPDFPAALKGKTWTQRWAQLDLDIRFGLWQNYSHWLEPDQQLAYWHESTVLEQSPVDLEVSLNDQIIFEHKFKIFETKNISYKFLDMEPGDCNLCFKFSGLQNLPIKDSDNSFVSGMFMIQSAKLQGMDITALMPDTLIGIDRTMCLPFSMPVYNWMISCWPDFLPKTTLTIPIQDIKKYNSKNLIIS